MYCAASYITYYDAISLARDWHVVGIDDYLLQIYSAYGLVGAVWLILGIFLKAVSVYRARMGKIHSDVMQKGFKALNSCLNKK
jgi:hypothetical protein